MNYATEEPKQLELDGAESPFRSEDCSGVRLIELAAKHATGELTVFRVRVGPVRKKNPDDPALFAMYCISYWLNPPPWTPPGAGFDQTQREYEAWRQRWRREHGVLEKMPAAVVERRFFKDECYDGGGKLKPTETINEQSN